MKKLILLSIILIVGCAPTTANYYIGMTKEEFTDNNSNNSSIQKEYYIGVPPEPDFDERITIYYEYEKSIGAWFDIFGLFTNYSLFFFDDSLYVVKHGASKVIAVDSSRAEYIKSLRKQKTKVGLSWRWRK